MIPNDREIPMFIPNEIFADLSKLKYKSGTHYAFTVSYYVLTSFLYLKSYYGSQLITQQEIKELLGYNGNNQQIDYIIKKDGLLDKSGYTKTTSDFPIRTEYNGKYSFITIDKVVKEFKNKGIKYQNANKNYKIKYPVKAFYRTVEDYKSKTLTGTFYDVRNTTKIDMRTFFKAMNNSDIGVIGFLIYLYVKYINSLCMGYDKLADILQISSRTIKTKINVLEGEKMIYVNRTKRTSYNTNSNIYTCCNTPTSILNTG